MFSFFSTLESTVEEIIKLIQNEITEQQKEYKKYSLQSFILIKGGHFHIPECCVLYNAFDFHNLSSSKQTDYLKEVSIHSLEYTPCPVCLKNQTFERNIHKCVPGDRECDKYIRLSEKIEKLIQNETK